MKRNNKKLLTILLAGMLCAATAGTVAAIAPVDASAATAKTYALTSVFSSGNATNVNNVVKSEGNKTKFVLSNGDSVKYDRNLAIQWFEAENQAKYTNIAFTFEDSNFQSVSFTFKSLPMHATKEDYSVNVIKFINTEGSLKVKVIADGQKEGDISEVSAPIVVNAETVLTLSAGSEIGQYSVNIGGTKVGEFANVGAKYFCTSTGSDDKANALEVSAACETGKTTKIALNSINGQSFALTDNKITDNAKPVMVVNEDVNEFLLGTRFQLDYNFIDVLADSISTTNASYYYQYNPTDTKVDYDSLLEIKKNGTYFMETVYKEGDETTTVYKENGAEYVSIKFNPKDGTFIDGEGDYKKAEYMLSWYANSTHTIGEVDYLVFNRNQTGPNYNNWTPADVQAYNDALANKAKGVSGGSNAEIELPSLAWLIEDANNGYNSLKFTISYKTHSSSSPTPISNKTSSELKIDAEEPGEYQFKVFATDAAGNAMYAKDKEGVDVKVTASNVWELDSIPVFSYTIAAKGLKPGENADKTTSDTKNIGETFTMSEVEIVGITGSKGSAYSLYKLDVNKYTGKGTITANDLSQIKFETLKKNAASIVNAKLSEGVTADKIDYVEVNKLAYAQALALRIGGDANKLASEIFVAIDEYNADIPADTEDWNNSDNKFEWKPASRSFKTAESGTYLILADYWDTEMEYVDHIPAYRLVEVNSPKDVIKGETEWLKNNIVSVVLFSVAALMLILIIILLLVKPSDETLEDVDEKIIAKRKQATDKNKKK